MSQEIAFYSKKADEVLIDVIRTGATVTFLSKYPVYSDLSLKTVIGIMGVKKEVFNIVDVPGPETFGVYTYAITWTVPDVKGIAEFVINVETKLVKDGSSELEGVYYGATNGVRSSGDFRNYGGSVRKIKDDTPIRKYLLKYRNFGEVNPYNTLP